MPLNRINNALINLKNYFNNNNNNNRPQTKIKRNVKER